MKQIVLIFMLFFIPLCYSQDSAVKSTLEKFGLNEFDHRGIVVYFSSDNSASTIQFGKLEDALKHFLESEEKKDLTYYLITEERDLYAIEGIPLDIIQIATVYNKCQK